MSAWGGAWGNAWGAAWGSVQLDPNAMAGAAGFALTAVANLTAAGGNALSGATTFTFSALGVLVDALAPTTQADTFPYARALAPAMGRYTADPTISRMALRMRKPRRW